MAKKQKKAKQQVVFDLIPTANPDEIIGHARYVVNDSTGIGMDVLGQIVKDHVPAAQNPETFTTKKVIRTERYECPCCPTDIQALVRVSCEGLSTAECKEVEGFYSITIYPERNHDCRVTVHKLTGTVIHESRVALLPKKDYKSSPSAMKEINGGH